MLFDINAIDKVDAYASAPWHTMATVDINKRKWGSFFWAFP
jgi:hypothetical protein